MRAKLSNSRFVLPTGHNKQSEGRDESARSLIYKGVADRSYTCAPSRVRFSLIMARFTSTYSPRLAVDVDTSDLLHVGSPEGPIQRQTYSSISNCNLGYESCCPASDDCPNYLSAEPFHIIMLLSPIPLQSRNFSLFHTLRTCPLPFQATRVCDSKNQLFTQYLSRTPWTLCILSPTYTNLLRIDYTK